MIINVMADGKIIEDLTGHIVTDSEAYAVIEAIEADHGADGQSRN